MGNILLKYDYFLLYFVCCLFVIFLLSQLRPMILYVIWVGLSPFLSFLILLFGRGVDGISKKKVRWSLASSLSLQIILSV
jgi:hypothetical protein